MIDIKTIALAAAITVASRIIYRCYLHPLAKYPGPFLGKFTNSWNYLTFYSGKQHIARKALHDRHGPVIRTGPNSLSFSSLEAYDAIYGFTHSLTKGNFYDFARWPDGSGSVFAAKGDAAYRLRRRQVGPAFRSALQASYQPTIAKHSAMLVDSVASSAAASAQPRSPAVNIADHIHEFVVDTFVEVIFGPNLHPELRAWSEAAAHSRTPAILREMPKHSYACALLPIANWLINTRAAIRFMRNPTTDAQGRPTHLSALVDRGRLLMTEKPELVTNVAQQSIGRVYLSAAGEHAMDPTGAFRECFNFIFAGPGSTSAALTALLHHLGTPDGKLWQNRLRAEIQRAKEKKGEGRKGEEPSLVGSTVMQAVFKETIRLHAPFSSAFPRDVERGAEDAIPGTRGPLPVGTLVSASTWVLGRSREIWGEDAEEWAPERWLRVEGAGSAGEDEGKADRLDEKLVAFSKGARSCPGKDMALWLVADAVAKVLARWEITSVGELVGLNFLEMQYSRCEVELKER